MQKVNPIRRGRVDQKTAFAAAGVHSPGRRVWFAVCPTCAAKVMHRPHAGRHSYATRKNTKDALYRHQQEHHKPGLVGR
jgi:cytochrome c5